MNRRKSERFQPSLRDLDGLLDTRDPALETPGYSRSVPPGLRRGPRDRPCRSGPNGFVGKGKGKGFSPREPIFAFLRLTCDNHAIHSRLSRSSCPFLKRDRVPMRSHPCSVK